MQFMRASCRNSRQSTYLVVLWQVSDRTLLYNSQHEANTYYICFLLLPVVPRLVARFPHLVSCLSNWRRLNLAPWSLWSVSISNPPLCIRYICIHNMYREIHTEYVCIYIAYTHTHVQCQQSPSNSNNRIYKIIRYLHNRQQ